MKVYRDLKGVVDTSYEEGLEEGVMIGEERGFKKGEKNKALEMARMMKNEGESVDKIARYTGLLKKDIEEL